MAMMGGAGSWIQMGVVGEGLLENGSQLCRTCDRRMRHGSTSMEEGIMSDARLGWEVPSATAMYRSVGGRIENVGDGTNTEIGRKWEQSCLSQSPAKD